MASKITVGALLAFVVYKVAQKKWKRF
jgi:hypothetical protein